jgi:chorismate dehydratase
MVQKSKIAMVSYLNSKPFEFGLSNMFKDEFEIITETPAQCAALFKNGSVDIALIPVGALSDLTSYKIVSDYCIGCDGEVRTVCIFSNQPLEQCNKLLLDNHSRTSYLLSQLLTTEYLGLNLTVSPLNIGRYIHDDDNAILMIGDKVFKYENDFTYKYDLGILWKEWTGLPFVFAVWVTRPEIEFSKIEKLNTALKFGVNNLDKIIEKESSENLDLYYYFSHNIQYLLDDQKQNGLKLFLQKSDLKVEKSKFHSNLE